MSGTSQCSPISRRPTNSPARRQRQWPRPDPPGGRRRSGERPSQTDRLVADAAMARIDVTGGSSLTSGARTDRPHPLTRDAAERPARSPRGGPSEHRSQIPLGPHPNRSGAAGALVRCFCRPPAGAKRQRDGARPLGEQPWFGWCPGEWAVGTRTRTSKACGVD